VAGGHVARRRAGGGDGIQALRPTRARLTLGASALVAAAAAAAYPPLLAQKAAQPLAVLSAGAVVAVLAAVLSRRDWLAVGGAGLLATGYTVALFVRGSNLDPRAPVYAALLVLVVELVAWSAQAGARIDAEAGGSLLRLGSLAAAVAASAAAAAVVLGAGVVDVAGGLAWEAAGVAAAVAAFALLAGLGRRS
jgi:hypothetical protein